MRRYTQKALDKRKEERKDFPEFFQKHVQTIKETKACCAECGCRLIGDVSEVAHVLNKSTYKSVSTDDENVIFLCSWRSENNCHGKFDNSTNEKFKQMNVFAMVAEIFKELSDRVKEKINFKTRERYEINE